ncbi:unnamed protein product [Rotaria socialis]|uniref:PCNA-interacting partner n=1 Tax=Rotaria socialis TaxID=392032 RepID=A0A817RRP2_9BILA|nr:unnamed protein product [Rotaria socialis]CAF3414403.1 unnamed protein product [Rotaria socialis]CAF3558578.1 unnamed protein product [Rotaria socialis]CAF3670015.1 unnamed protein product [Rotaria socialis]CAF4192333.1 unnamed protein product [Rotaria socialis]
MHIKLMINNAEDENLIDVSLDSSSTISSWLIDYYFTKFYFTQVKSSKKSVQPNNIIGLHDMFVIYQIIQSKSSSNEFFELCKNKLAEIENDALLDSYNNHLNRCGLKDIIDLLHQCKLKSLIKEITFTINNVKNEIDRLILSYLLEVASERLIYDDNVQLSTSKTIENILALFDNEKKHVEQTISKNFIKHTICTYLALLLDTRNEHALIHCLATPARAGIERRTIVELRRLSKLSKNECLTIYQILLSFLRRKELTLNRSSQQDSLNNEDESFMILDKCYVGVKEFFDFIEHIQMTIEENEHAKIESIVTFRKIMTMISKQLRKDSSFSRCDVILKDVIEEFCQCFQTTLPLMDCTSPIRSASSGGTLAGRRFLRSIAYLCAKQTIHLPIILSNNDHYDSPSTGLRKATSCRLLQSPITPLPLIIEFVPEAPIEEKSVEIAVESVFMWQKSTKEKDDNKTEVNSSSSSFVSASSKNKHYRRRKSQRCLNLSTIREKSFDSDSVVDHFIDSNDKISSQTCSSGSTRQPLGEIDINSFNSDERSATENENSSASQHPILFSLVSGSDKENLPVTVAKRTMKATNTEQPHKKQKKTNNKPLVVGQKMITSFFRSN